MSLQDAINYLRKQVPAFAKELTPMLVYFRRKMLGRITRAYPTIEDVEGELYNLLEDWDDDMEFTEQRTANSFLRVEKYEYNGRTRMRMMLIVESRSSPVETNAEELAAKPPKPGEDVESDKERVMKNNKGGKNMVKLSTQSIIFTPMHGRYARAGELEKLAVKAYEVKTVRGHQICRRTLSREHLDFFFKNYNQIIRDGEFLFSIRLCPKK